MRLILAVAVILLCGCTSGYHDYTSELAAELSLISLEQPEVPPAPEGGDPKPDHDTGSAPVEPFSEQPVAATERPQSPGPVPDPAPVAPAPAAETRTTQTGSSSPSTGRRGFFRRGRFRLRGGS